MKEKNITALVSSFVRYYHHKNSNIKVYDDKNCDKVLTFEEYLNIKENMVDGIKYFNPSFKGTEDDAILWIVNNQIGPSVLGRSAFNKKMLKNAIKLGCGQYLVYASGYDISSLDYNIKCFEIDKKQYVLLSITPIFSSIVIYFICMFLSTFTNKTKKMFGISLGIVFISYVFQTISTLDKSVEFLKYISVFTLADIRNVIVDISINPLMVFISVLLSIIFLILTITRYNKKELV